MVKRVIAAHDISCFGRCSMQVAIPVLSRFGLQVCPLPTALLSTHTGGFENNTFLDLTDEMLKIVNHWESLDLKFDAVYSGFLGNEHQTEILEEVFTIFPAENALKLVDPVMGDNGKLYRTYTAEMCKKMKSLCRFANILTPNLTEAFILAEEEFQPYPSAETVKELLKKLIGLCETDKKLIVITGIQNREKDEIGVCFYDNLTDKNRVGSVFSPYCHINYPGCGDLLASMLLGELLSGNKALTALKKTVDFISKASFSTKNTKSPIREGIIFEENLYEKN